MLDARAERRRWARNALQSTLLVGCLVTIAAGTAWLLFGTVGLLALAGLVRLLRPRIPARRVLEIYGAARLPYPAAPELHVMVRELCRRARLHRSPTLYYVPSPVPNCFSLGTRRDAAIGLTDGLVRRLARRELAGVLAHEIGHIHAGDPAVMSLSDAISRMAQVLSWVGMVGLVVSLPLAIVGRPRPLLLAAAAVLLPIVVSLVQLALSRARELEADLAAARLTGGREGLARTLEVLEWSSGRIWERLLVTRGQLPDPFLLRTHPPTAERTRRLRLLEPGYARWPDDAGWFAPAGYPHVPGPPRLRFPGVRW